ncbi:hypothetical protein [Ornithinimicrobium sp. Y1694]|uniref:hypothetical protein n=1 Tax=Ornithinimicrobium sp. Y1694 TaxID=3418590 RepID=UPI003CE69466
MCSEQRVSASTTRITDTAGFLYVAAGVVEDDLPVFTATWEEDGEFRSFHANTDPSRGPALEVDYDGTHLRASGVGYEMADSGRANPITFTVDLPCTYQQDELLDQLNTP